MAKWGEKTPNLHQENEEEVDLRDKDLTEGNLAEGEVHDGGEEVLEDVPEVSMEEKILTLEAELKQSKEQADDYYARLQRLQAEFDNFRKRSQKEREDTLKYASEQVIVAMLPILDNFERAVASSQSNQDFKSFLQGVEMILKQMKTGLEKEGLAPIEAVGQTFDPKLHDAVLQVDSEEYKENTVVEELQRGYYLKDKVLRPSMVKVSR
ncbi:nucleotide exchange factor GrpE [Desulfitobacterium metallireducens]|uniref:Protein GrpE n=1 Tax=Desulfitobacterium metallireducens DSM 15288 TaxID=871968 RepID=W0EED2_9FIRM|nr:nucleotide exchange factor GrpE [Desulfitobacterium metallireducens]AHF07873.1 molecular chaperone GrpE [Desulfitobacterium metallireducens DSM 15288]